jgi:hypothetical protein
MEFTEIETALADKPEALAFVKGLHEKAGKLTPELEADIGKLSEYKGHSEAYAKLLKETGAKDVDGLLKDFGNLKTTNADLVSQREKWKAGGKNTDSPEYRALQEQIEAGQKALKEITDKMTAAEQKAADAAVNERKTALKSSIIAAAGKAKATEPEDIHILLEARGLIGHKEDGTPFFYKQNEKKENVAVGSADDVVAWLAETRKDLFTGSGIGGTGGKHRGGAPGTDDLTPKSAKANFLASRGVG